MNRPLLAVHTGFRNDRHADQASELILSARVDRMSPFLEIEVG